MDHLKIYLKQLVFKMKFSPLCKKVALACLLALKIAQAAPDIPNVLDVSENGVRLLNERHGNAAGSFVRKQANGIYYVLFQGGLTPNWAIDGVLDHLGAEKGYGTGGVDPFKLYSHDEWTETLSYHYLTSVRRAKDVWAENFGINNPQLGLNLMEGDINNYGKTLYKGLYEYEMRRQQRAELLDEFFPQLLEVLKSPAFVSVVMIGVLALIGLPMIIWNAAKSFFAWLFVSSPEIVSPEDTDIYKSFWGRLFFVPKKLPKVIANPKLDAKLKTLIRENKKITTHNKKITNAKIFPDTSKYMPYAHVLAYGFPGVGKTLFAKMLARKSGMHFLYLTFGDLAQMSEEQALQEFKKVLYFCQTHRPVVLILDEFEILFRKSDLKMAKMRVLFQKFFPNATHDSVQLFCITNYPSLIPKPALGRLLHRFHFTKPTLETINKLFESYLQACLAAKSKAKSLTLALSNEEKNNLVGRDIQYICARFALSKRKTLKALKKRIQEHKKAHENLKQFDMDGKPNQRQEIVPKPSKQSKKWFLRQNGG